MALLTTTIGAYPKPDYVPTPDWFREGGTGLSNPTEAYQKYLTNLPNKIEEILDRGTQEVVKDQVNVGVDIEDSSIQAISLEDAHRQNDLSLLEQFKTTTVMLGVIAIANSRIETVTEITERLQAALKHIDADRLIAAPDCGLGFLNRELALAKLTNMVSAAKSVSD